MEGNKPAQQRDEYGRFVKVTSSVPSFVQNNPSKGNYPDLIDLRVSNPVTYLKLWLAQFFKNSEITFTVKIRPMALISLAIAISIILGGTGFSLFYFITKLINGF